MREARIIEYGDDRSSGLFMKLVEAMDIVWSRGEVLEEYSTIVQEGYRSPYRGCKLLRDALDDPEAECGCFYHPDYRVWIAWGAVKAAWIVVGTDNHLQIEKEIMRKLTSDTSVEKPHTIHENQ